MFINLVCDTQVIGHIQLFMCFADINECASYPCDNGGTCKDDVNRYTCICVPGYTGVNCETSTSNTNVTFS